jgi:hypothetical protein
VSGGNATYATSTLTAGTHSITAIYTPTTGSAFTTSSAIALSQVVNAAATGADFTISASPSMLSIQPGAAANYTITLQSINGIFGNAVTLTVAGLPTGATASFTSGSVTPGAGGQNTTLTIQTPAVAMASPPGKGFGWPMTTPALALILLLPFRRWRKLWAGKLLLLVACLASLGTAVALTGCGGGFGFNQSQTYTLTVTGTSGSDTHSTTVQLTVQ